MQEDDLKNLGQLFEKAGDGMPEEKWKDRFEEFVKKSMAEHATRLKSVAGEMEKRAEAFRAKWDLFGIVEQRLNARCEAKGDPGMAKALMALQKAQGDLFQELLGAISIYLSSTPGTPNLNSSFGDSPDTLNLQLDDEEDPIGRGSVWQNSQSPISPRSLRSSPIRKGNQDATSPDVLENTMTPRSPDPRSPKSPNPGEVFREISKCNSYATRHKKTKAMTGVSDDSWGNRLSVGKELSLTQLMNIISSVYQTKADLDSKISSDEVVPLELHFYRFLQERYGIHAVREWADAIFKAVQKFSAKEVRVAAFGKILQNKLSEDFPRTLETLCSKLQMSAREKMEEKMYGNRQQAEIETLWQAALNGRDRCGIQLSDCKHIVCHLYNENDSEDVMLRLQQECRRIASDQSNALPPDCIKLRDFCQVVCVFQMHLTENFLSDFIQIFHVVTEHHTGSSQGSQPGVLEAAQLTELVRRLSHVDGLASHSGQIAPLLEAREKATAQALQVKRATFSQCVNYFSALISARYGAVEWHRSE